MPKKAFEKIAEGLKEAINVVQGGATPADWHYPQGTGTLVIRKKASRSKNRAA